MKQKLVQAAVVFVFLVWPALGFLWLISMMVWGVFHPVPGLGYVTDAQRLAAGLPLPPTPDNTPNVVACLIVGAMFLLGALGYGRGEVK